MHVRSPWRALAPIAVAVILALLPAPEGLPQHAWYYFAIFAGVIAGLMFEPLPGGAVGLIGVVVAAETILAPVTPPNTARSAGTIYPIIRNVPALYDSKPNDPSARRIGSYIMWISVAAVSVTSSLFLTGLAPNLLALELVRKTANIEFDWVTWFVAFAP